MLKKISVILIVLFLLGICFAEITIVRDVQNQYVAQGGEVEIIINLSLGGEDPSSIIVIEEIPQGWEFVSSQPTAKKFGDQLKWLLFGSNLTQNKNLKYTLKAPQSFEEIVLLNGGWKTLQTGGVTQGDAMLQKELPQEAVPDAPMDYTLLIGLVAVIIVIIAVVSVVKKKKN